MQCEQKTFNVLYCSLFIPFKASLFWNASIMDAKRERISTACPMNIEHHRGRGARSNASGRYEQYQRSSFDDGWMTDAKPATLQTTVQLEYAKSVITHNDSPDLSFDQSLNPYRGCEHGCSYCYARPTHAFVGHSPGLDFETNLYAKTNAAEVLEAAFRQALYQVKTIAIGSATDAYQPIERKYKITRRILQIMERYRHPFVVATKSHLITRDIDILAPLAELGLTKVALSVTTLDSEVARKMEPRAATPARRLQAIAQLSAAGIPTTVLVAPIVPGLNDHEIEQILCAAKQAGATSAAYVLLRLPLELKQLFREWLASEFPNRMNRVINILQDMHGGRDYCAEFHVRQRGRGPFANLIAMRFRQAIERYGLNEREICLRTDLFQKPASFQSHRPQSHSPRSRRSQSQMDLFAD